MTEMMVAYLQDEMELVRKGDYRETFLFYEDDGVTPKNTTGWLMTMWITKGPNGEEFDTLTTDGVRIVNTPASGQFNLNILKAEIEAYNWTTADYRIGIDYGTGVYQVWRMGKIKVV